MKNPHPVPGAPNPLPAHASRPPGRGRHRPTLLSLPIAVLATACATTPPPEPVLELEAPDSWSAELGDAESVSGPWWTDFADPELDRLIAAALEENYDLQAAAAAVDAATARARIAGADLKPQIGAGFDAARRQQIFVGFPIPGQDGPLKTRSTSYGTSLNVSWEADLWGRLRAGKRAAAGDAQAAEIDYRAARLSLSGQVAKAWFAVVETQHQVDLAAKTVASRRQTRERVEARYRSGVAPPLDLRLARANEAGAESTVELRRRQLDGARRQLEILLGRYPAGELAKNSAPRLPEISTAIPAGLPSELVARRPDLRAAERRLQSAGWRVHEARRALYPKLTLTGSAGTSSDRLEDLVDGDFSVWSIAGGLLAPIFQGGRLRAAVDFAEASREQALAGYAQGILRAFAEVESALTAERLLTAETAAQAVATEESTAAVRLAEDRYQAGVGEFLSILESQRRAFLSESRLLTLRALRLGNRVDLHLALGGDFGSAQLPPAGGSSEPADTEASAPTTESTP